MHSLAQNHGLIILVRRVICRGEIINQNEVSVGMIRSIFRGKLYVYVLIVRGYDGYQIVLFQYSSVSTQFWLCLRVSYLLQKMWVETSVSISWRLRDQEPFNVSQCWNVVSICFMSPSQCHYFLTTSVRRTHVLQLTIDHCLLNGVPSWKLLHNLFYLPSPGTPKYFVNQNEEWTLSHSVL